MLPAAVSHPKDDKTAPAHLITNVQAAAAGDLHPGDWRRHTLVTVNAPGDFTPARTPDYAETHQGLLGELLRYPGEVLGPGYSQSTAQRGLEAGQ